MQRSRSKSKTEWFTIDSNSSIVVKYCICKDGSFNFQFRHKLCGRLIKSDAEVCTSCGVVISHNERRAVQIAKRQAKAQQRKSQSVAPLPATPPRFNTDVRSDGELQVWWNCQHCNRTIGRSHRVCQHCQRPVRNDEWVALAHTQFAEAIASAGGKQL